ncbi:MAG TPA: cupredoxin domain-containing protein [Acidimicrobiia bacterium]|jgi:plastocyanin
MRKCLTAAVAALSILALAGVAGAAAPAKEKPPVKLKGKVNNKGIGVVSNGETDLEADDFYYQKTFEKAKAGTTVKVTIENEGSTQHTFTIDAQHIDKTIQPGAKAKVKVKIPSNGKPVNFYCRFHVDQGMQGVFFTKAGATVGSKSSSGGGSSSGY